MVIINSETLKPIFAEKVDNNELLQYIYDKCCGYFDSYNYVAIEMVASYGMAVGAEVFETVFWIGRFWEIAKTNNKQLIYRKDEKMNLCHTMKAKDSNIIQALVDRFAFGIQNKGKGTKKNPGWFYGFSKDIWQAYAVGVTYSGNA